MDEFAKMMKVRWRGMMKRCYSSGGNAETYKERGILVCRAWHDCGTFLEYARTVLGDFPKDGQKYTIDRIDNDGHYAPGNIRWATLVQQAANRSNTVTVLFRGRRLTLVDLCRTTGLPFAIVYDRMLRQGWSAEDAVSIPVSKANRVSERSAKTDIVIEHRGKTIPLKKAPRALGVSAELARTRLRSGWTVDAALSEPPDKGRSSKGKEAKFEFRGAVRPLSEIAAMSAIGVDTLRYRLKQNLSIDQATAHKMHAKI